MIYFDVVVNDYMEIDCYKYRANENYTSRLVTVKPRDNFLHITETINVDTKQIYKQEYTIDKDLVIALRELF